MVSTRKVGLPNPGSWRVPISRWGVQVFLLYKSEKDRGWHWQSSQCSLHHTERRCLGHILQTCPTRKRSTQADPPCSHYLPLRGAWQFFLHHTSSGWQCYHYTFTCAGTLQGKQWRAWLTSASWSSVLAINWIYSPKWQTLLPQKAWQAAKLWHPISLHPQTRSEELKTLYAKEENWRRVTDKGSFSLGWTEVQ